VAERSDRTVTPHRGQRRDGGDFAGAQIETGTAVDVSEWELEQVVCEVGKVQVRMGVSELLVTL